MRIIDASWSIETPESWIKTATQVIERAGRTCYKSDSKIEPGSDIVFAKSILKSGHESVIEHFNITVKFICDRGVSHELVRHRLCSFSQESTRYCNYSNERFGNEITVIRPCFWKDGSPEYRVWKETCESAEIAYRHLINWGSKAQEARSILPNSLKTEVVMTANLREWRHILKLRTSPAAHPQMRELMIPLLKYFQGIIPVIFDDIQP